MLQIEFTRLLIPNPSVNPNTFSIIKEHVNLLRILLTYIYMLHILSKTRTKMVMRKDTKKSKWHITGKKFQKWESMDKNLTIPISFRMPIFTCNSGLEPSNFSTICIMRSSEWKMSHSFLFLKMNFEKPQCLYYLYTPHLQDEPLRKFVARG